MDGIIALLRVQKETISRAILRRRIQQLNSKHKYDRLSAARWLGRRKDSQAREALTAALKDEDYEVRQAAAESLGQIGDLQSIEPLMRVLTDRDSVSKAAFEALAKIGGDEVVDKLAEVLKTGDDSKRRRAAETLGRAGNVRAIDPLLEALNDNHHVVRETAAKALVSLGWQPQNDAQQALHLVASGNWYQLEKSKPTVAIPLIVKVLTEDGHYSVSKAAFEALAKIGGNEVVDKLAVVLKTGDDSKRQKAVEALGKLGDVRAVDPLLEALDFGNDCIRWTAARSLGKLGDVRAIDPLLEALNDNHYVVRRITAEELVSLGWQPQNDAQQALHLVASGNWYQLEKSKPTAAIQPLVKVLSDNNDEIRSEASKTLTSLGWQPGNDTQQASYAIARCEWAKVISSGAVAVMPLVKVAVNSKDLAQQAIDTLERILESSAKDIALDDLYEVTNLKNIYQNYDRYETETVEGPITNGNELGWGTFSNTTKYVDMEEVNCSLAIHLAQMEITERKSEI
jgi:HEAT repeat protein